MALSLTGGAGMQEPNIPFFGQLQQVFRAAETGPQG